MDQRPKQGSGPSVVRLGDPAAADPDLTGAKAANLASAMAAGLPVLPGVVLTTAWSKADRGAARAAWREVSDDGTRSVIVRSSSTGEDGSASSMAGVFESVADVRDEEAFDAAVDLVLTSGERAAADGMADGEMAVLIQPQLPTGWGGVLFTADPLTGKRNRRVVTAAPAGPSDVVSGVVEGWTAVLRRNGSVAHVRAHGEGAPPALLRIALARLARAVEQTFGAPQDVEWSVDQHGSLHLLQSRPITTLPLRRGAVFGPGPVAESFPDALSPLEQELWLEPMRAGLREALLLSGAASERQLGRTPLLVAVDGMAAVDLDALGADDRPRSLLSHLDPRPPARRLRAAWQVGRLRHALPELATDVIRRVDADLAAVPALDELGNQQLLALLRNGRRSLTSLHGYEALAGLLVPGSESAAVTGASLALAVVSEAGSEGASLDELVASDPVVLALLPPRIGPTPNLDQLLPTSAGAHDVAGLHLDHAGAPEAAAIAREALRLRIRWLQELMARAAWELGRRLVAVRLFADQDRVRLVSYAELSAAVGQRVIPADLDQRVEPAGQRIPARFRLTDDGRAAVLPARRRRITFRQPADLAGVGAGGGIATGPVHLGLPADAPAGSVLVVTALDPRLAPVIPRLAGLVAATGSPLSHLAILAREHGVATVVGLADATTRFTAGATVTVDGQAGTVQASAEAVIDLTGAGDPATIELYPLGVQP